MREAPQATRNRLEWAAWVLLCLFIFTIPWEKSVWAPGVGTVARITGTVAFAAGVAAALRRGSVRLPNLALVLAGLLVIWAAATFLWSVDRPATAIRVRTLAELLAMACLIWDQARDSRRQRQIIGAYVTGAVAASFLAFYRYVTHQQTNYRRYAATGFDPNDFGLVLALAVPLALYLGLRERGWIRWCARAAVPIVVAAIFLTASRTALVATFVAFVFALWTWRDSDLPQRALAVLLLLVLSLSLFRFGPAPQRKRLATIGSEIRQGTFHNRTRIWKTGLKVFKSHPLRGVGVAAYPQAVSPWLGKRDAAGFLLVAHNTFLSVLVETGLAGFGLFALLLVTLAVFVWTMPGAERALWAVMLAVWAVGVSTLTWEQYKPTWLLMALIMTGWAAAGSSGRPLPYKPE